MVNGESSAGELHVQEICTCPALPFGHYVIFDATLLRRGIISVPTYYTKLTATYMKTLPVHVLINRSDAKPFNFFV
ncbi:hypothetical protein IGI04_013810 [Brassica rapa subsp. trilocularis]|uniref:Uncharacterized protein n=1 Tax=Brassica rapa subsp. trilocularis TaxID=1813537 RepID=A0ABQ7NC12_BRACM|nr:hypothetical protein IGI04_013810 [Brassica rapa subsp. trilocularis]